MRRADSEAVLYRIIDQVRDFMIFLEMSGFQEQAGYYLLQINDFEDLRAIDQVLKGPLGTRVRRRDWGRTFLDGRIKICHDLTGLKQYHGLSKSIDKNFSNIKDNVIVVGHLSCINLIAASWGPRRFPAGKERTWKRIASVIQWCLESIGSVTLSPKYMCQICGRSTKSRCSRCMTVFYCGQGCQMYDYEQHMASCQVFNRINGWLPMSRPEESFLGCWSLMACLVILILVVGYVCQRQ